VTGRECDTCCSLWDIPRAQLRLARFLERIAESKRTGGGHEQFGSEIKLKLVLAPYGCFARLASSSLLCQGSRRIVIACEGKPAARRGRKATGPKGVPDDSGVAAVKAKIVISDVRHQRVT
jgi:hypothetical protein